ncbi:cas scaffolding protein family member 4 [Sorex araneus]|uniref:cas scaffolding protein family member 4 n=1 Tax=Sorex araneus TaxID=42254 RepID=UPI0024336847|nr:cas scaffolding protein family member 4 [Sorex araneus]
MSLGPLSPKQLLLLGSGFSLLSPAAPQTLLARALYDNQAEGPEELAFCRGDVLVVVAQDVAGGEGWWQCLLHGRSGLAPANRLQVLPGRPAPTMGPSGWARPPPPDGRAEHGYQTPAAGPVYEPMKGWVEGPPSAQVYVLPGPPAPGSTPGGAQGSTWNGGERPRVGARIVCEKMGRLPQQESPSVPLVLPQEPAGQWLYDVLPQTPKSALGAHHANGQADPPTPMTLLRPGSYSTLPTPPKPEWVYDIPGPPQPAGARNRPLTALCVGGQGPRYRVPPSFQGPRQEAQNTRPNVYDLPRGREGVPPPGRAPRKTPGAAASEKCPELHPAWPGPELDRASVSSPGSRASVSSSCSSVSTDSSSGSCCEDVAREPPGDLSTAREVVTGLQQQVAGSVAGLMLFVSRTWRVRDHLEANITAIRRAAEGVEEALGEFLEFAQGVRWAAARHLADGVLQARIRDQLQTISDAHRVLRESKGALESSDWSPDVLATDKLQNQPDDLERFVTAARMVPEDIKRFASMVIANGRLLFGEHGEREEPEPPAPSAEPGLENRVLLLPRGMESPPRHAPSSEQGTAVPCPGLPKGKGPGTRHQKLSSLEGEEKPPSKPRLEGDSESDTQHPGAVLPGPPRPQEARKRVQLSEHCRLYFGALLKASGVLGGSLQSGQPPEVFITQSKLVIRVGQKLVDTLCRETQDRDTRNEILGASSQLCGQLRDVALATKRAVLQHPCPAARAHLLAELRLLEQKAQQFRANLE